MARAVHPKAETPGSVATQLTGHNARVVVMNRLVMFLGGPKDHTLQSVPDGCKEVACLDGKHVLNLVSIGGITTSVFVFHAHDSAHEEPLP